MDVTKSKIMVFEGEGRTMWFIKVKVELLVYSGCLMKEVPLYLIAKTMKMEVRRFAGAIKVLV